MSASISFVSAVADASTPAARDKIIKKINRRLPDGQRIRVFRGCKRDAAFALVDGASNVIRLIADARALVSLAIEIGAGVSE